MSNLAGAKTYIRKTEVNDIKFLAIKPERENSRYRTKHQ